MENEKKPGGSAGETGFSAPGSAGKPGAGFQWGSPL